MGGIYIWGTGCGAGEVLQKIKAAVSIEAYVDSYPVSESFMGRPVIKPEKLRELRPELVIVSARQSGEIFRQCMELGLERERLLFVKNSVGLSDMNLSREIAQELLGRECLDALIPTYHVVAEPMKKYETVLSQRDYENDYIRIKSLEAAARKIAKLPGAAAELGVYRGSFARCINAVMPERRLYLFDSFEGFESSEAAREKSLGRLSEGVAQAHKNTSLKKVMGLMPHPESVQPMPGYFPDSLNGLEESFAFVSLDADLEESTLAGLSYFVPRMLEGGYIFLHDYDSHEFEGVRNALERYEKDNDIRFRTMPLPDLNGTLVLCF